MYSLRRHIIRCANYKVIFNMNKWICSSYVLPSEWAAVVLELKKRPKPRSPSLTIAVFVTNTLAGLISNNY